MTGYNGYSKSNNAINAERRGLVTATALGKQLGVSSIAIATCLDPAEWHHTSKEYNCTDYYRWDTDDMADDDIDPAELVAKMKAFDRERSSTRHRIGVTVTYSEWHGRGQSKKREELTLENCVTVERGSTTTVHYIDWRNDVVAMKKKTNGNWITFRGGEEVTEADSKAALTRMKRRASARRRKLTHAS